MDYRSPYSHLALNGLGRLGASFEVTLIDVGWVMKRVNNQPSPECPPKLKYAWMDSGRSAAHDGVPFAPNRRSLDAVRRGLLPAQFLLRAGVAAKKLGFDAQFNTALFSCLYAGNDDLTLPEVREHLLTANQIKAPTLWDDVTARWTEEALNQNNVKAVEKGVFGVPTTFADDEMFFGNDRMHLIRKKMGAESIAA